MHQRGSKRIYWANGLFAEADRAFNALCARRVRDAGYEVFLPQEAEVNVGVSPTSEDVFRVDTVQILKSDLLVACLDQETIDCGVACEIGIAYAFGVPVIGLYTDIRQFRTGPSHMYKNLYVLGAIEAKGEIVSNVDGLIALLPMYLEEPHEDGKQRMIEIITHHYRSVAHEYAEFVKRLESWYHPLWSQTDTVDDIVSSVRPAAVLEYGCGTGTLGRHLITNFKDLIYWGYDASLEMVRIARERHGGDRCRFTGDIMAVRGVADLQPFELTIASFVLHDLPNKSGALRLLAQCTREGGHILIIDLSTSDLPLLTRHLREGLGRPALAKDPRISSDWLREAAETIGLDLKECRLVLPKILFPSGEELERYLEIFGIAYGMDLPLGLQAEKADKWRSLIPSVLNGLTFPFEDQRSFVVCNFQRRRNT